MGSVISYQDRILGEGGLFFIFVSVLHEGGGWSPEESQQSLSAFLQSGSLWHKHVFTWAALQLSWNLQSQRIKCQGGFVMWKISLRELETSHKGLWMSSLLQGLGDRKHGHYSSSFWSWFSNNNGCVSHKRIKYAAFMLDKECVAFINLPPTSFIPLGRTPFLCPLTTSQHLIIFSWNF